MRRILSAFTVVVLLVCLMAASRLAGRLADQEALAPFQAFVGEWRGAGQIQRGSTDGAWSEQSSWAWKFTEDRASLVFEAPKAKHLLSGELRPSDKTGEWELAAVAADGKTILYRGGRDEAGRLVLTVDDSQAAGDYPARISLRLLAEDKRLVALYERRLSSGDSFTRLAEVGYTRVGSGFGAGSRGAECVVTGGFGSIEVSHAGKTYYVCCTGCRDLFNDDPERILAEYRARKAKPQD